MLKTIFRALTTTPTHYLCVKEKQATLVTLRYQRGTYTLQRSFSFKEGNTLYNDTALDPSRRLFLWLNNHLQADQRAHMSFIIYSDTPLPRIHTQLIGLLAQLDVSLYTSVTQPLFESNSSCTHTSLLALPCRLLPHQLPLSTIHSACARLSSTFTLHLAALTTISLFFLSLYQTQNKLFSQISLMQSEKYDRQSQTLTPSEGKSHQAAHITLLTLHFLIPRTVTIEKITTSPLRVVLSSTSVPDLYRALFCISRSLQSGDTTISPVTISAHYPPRYQSQIEVKTSTD